MEFLIELQDEAKFHIQKNLKKLNVPFLRVGVKSGGCDGFLFEFDYTTEIKKKDLIVECGDFKIICDHKSAKILNGCQLIFNHSLLHFGLDWEMDQNISTERCGCGKSFSIK